MNLKYVVIGIIIAGLLASNINLVSASSGRDLTEEERESGFYNERGYAISYQGNRPAINPDFDPDYSCLFDVYQLKCIPGAEQECPEGFGTNEDATCFPLIDNGEWGCPEGYHTEDDDETGQCYPNDEGCGWGVLLTDRPGKSDRCADLSYICNEDEHREREYCIEFCNEDPERSACRPEIS